MHKLRDYIVVPVQLGAVKLYAAATTVEALRKKERQDETQFTTKIWWFSEFRKVIWSWAWLSFSYLL